ncbi:MAG: MBL fold metallo-hydrolase [Treponema sp.]|nr:MBL fold metallo-hydrolase [Treponema sp.]
MDKPATLPDTVICAHGHIDHAGGALWFDEVYLDPLDS